MLTETKQKIDRLLDEMIQSEEAYELHYAELDTEMKTLLDLMRKDDKHEH